MTAYGRVEVELYSFLTCTRQWVVRFRVWPLNLPTNKSLQYPQNKRLYGFQYWSGHFIAENKLFHCQQSNHISLVIKRVALLLQ
jgi:hypothetical protein